ncbi:MAG TPA: septum formation initiator family protein [Bacteroidales bacterium]|nr:septum formation initiator family protein [Bacteroidales bacterium]HOU95885.1 septum formation initiator family protein [Bacteroidales bacterium]HQG35886.1 septum formation initiator family protein [Bacteroidales bacterium]HQG52396.1 septum formation initiator family protein [Bacteroidales bacterium]HQJ20105.1 septum formation initiator family protein [Bacteroidales bacterium]
MKIRLKYADHIPPLLRNKYFLAVAIFLVWIFLLDSNNLIDRFGQMNEIRKLKKEKEYYEKKINEDKKTLEKLKEDNDYFEKFAREKYLMKKEDEELFIVITPREERTKHQQQ